jgi:UDP-3-O-[3-hydroxymyristoyl] glucosamine N-acyltransferase
MNNTEKRAFALSWLAERLSGELVLPGTLNGGAGGDIQIGGAAGLEHAGPGDITYISDPSKMDMAEESAASAVIVPLEVEESGKPIIRIENPRLAFAQMLGLFALPAGLPVGVHPMAIIGTGAVVGKDAAIGPYVIVGERANIAEGVVIHPQAYIGENVKIGEGSLLYPQVVIGRGTEIGAHCILYPGAVIGADGFGYVWDGERHRKVPQIGRVVIEDDVEIGANSTIDRATTHITRIGRGTKIDDQVHIAHNVTIGENCVIAGNVGISGSVRLGNRVILAGQVGIGDHISIGDDAIVLARAAVLSDLPAGSVSSGTPAYSHKENLRVEAAARKLPELLREMRQLRQRLSALEESKGDRSQT